MLSQALGVARSRGTHFVITANRVDDGSAVYMRVDGSWAPRLREAWATASEDVRDGAVARARTQEDVICDPYSFKVVIGPEGPRATSVREQIRGVGPTTPLRQADPLPATRLSA